MAKDNLKWVIKVFNCSSAVVASGSGDYPMLQNLDLVNGSGCDAGEVCKGESLALSIPSWGVLLN